MGVRAHVDRMHFVIVLDLARRAVLQHATVVHHGHAVGDKVLQSVARRLEAVVRNSDTVSRLGGDEYVGLLSEVACAEDVTCAADALCANIAAPHRIEGRDMRVTASVGIAVYPGDGTDAETLMKNADFALLNAKACRRARPKLVSAAMTRVGSTPR